MTKLRVLTQNLFGVPVGPPFWKEVQLYHVHRLYRFRKFVEWVEQMQQTTGTEEPTKDQTFVGQGLFDIIGLQEVFKWRTGPFSRFVLLPIWRSISLSGTTRFSSLLIAFHYLCIVVSWIDGIYWGFLGCVWDDQQYIIDLAKARLGLNFASTPRLPPIRYLSHAMVWAVTAAVVAPIIVVRYLVGVWQAWLTACVIIGGGLALVLFALCRFRTNIVDFLSSRTSVSPFTIDSGVVLLSRQEPLHRGRLVYNYVPGSGLEGFFCQKGAVWLDIELNSGERLRVLNTHLQSDVDSTCRVRPSAVRELQFQQLRNDCTQTKSSSKGKAPTSRTTSRSSRSGSSSSSSGSGSGNDEADEKSPALLMMGDLNIWRRAGDAEYNTAKEIMGLKGLENEHLITHRYSRNHFDYIWMSAEKVADARVQAHQGHGELFISDHNGVEGEIVCT